MIENNTVKNLLGKKLNRKEFLQHLAFFFFGLIGINGMISSLVESPDEQRAKKASAGGRRFGSNKYSK